ncbi:MAG: hypothetical protein U0166_05630 [Acidobacteriota bacterium]
MTSERAWLVSPRWDLAMLLAPSLLAFGLLAFGAARALLHAALPAWIWIGTVVFVDVAHVWATAYRVYLDPREMAARPGLALGVPALAYVTGVVLYTATSSGFWRVLAYLAVIHFVRQQYGWVALAGRRRGASSHLDRYRDAAAIDSATIYPLLYWHAHLPREIAWLIDGDFIPGLPAWVAAAAWPLHLAITGAYVARQVVLVARGRAISIGKNIVIATTWLTWYVGIVAFDSDYAFTVTNVLVHGIPYIGFVWIHGRQRWTGQSGPVARLFQARALPFFLLPLLGVAFAEEWLWDRSVWHEHGALFPGAALHPGPEVLALLVPLLALPQAVHYVLDGFVWRVRPHNAALVTTLGLDLPRETRLAPRAS